MAEKYDLIFNLGSIPEVSQLMHNMELQVFDYPFDFISGGDFLVRMSLFLLDCTRFMEQKNISVQKNTPKEGMTLFKDMQTGFVYHNEFNAELPIENTFPSVKLKYDRYIRNLSLNINAAKKILLVYIENPQQPEDDNDNASLVLEACQKLKTKYPKKEFKILYVKNDEDVENIKVIQLGKNAEQIIFNFYRKFSETSAPFIDFSMLSMIFTDIQLKKSWRLKKIFFYQKILNKIIEIKRNIN